MAFSSGCDEDRSRMRSEAAPELKQITRAPRSKNLFRNDFASNLNSECDFCGEDLESVAVGEKTSLSCDRLS